MTINVSNKAPGVYSQEVDQSQIIVEQNTTGAAIAVRCLQGSPNPTLITSQDQFKAVFGPFDGSISHSLDCAEDYLVNGSDLWVTRVQIAGDEYAWNVFSNVSQWLDPTSGTPDDYHFVSTDAFKIVGVGAGAFYNGIFISILENANPTGGVQTYSLVITDEKETVLESWNISFKNSKNSSGNQSFAETVVNGLSLYVNIYVNPDFASGDGILNNATSLVATATFNSTPTMLLSSSSGSTVVTGLDKYSSAKNSGLFYVFGGVVKTTVSSSDSFVYNVNLLAFNAAQNSWSSTTLTLDSVLSALVTTGNVPAFLNGTLFYYNNALYWFGNFQTYTAGTNIVALAATPVLIKLDLITKTISKITTTLTLLTSMQMYATSIVPVPNVDGSFYVMLGSSDATTMVGTFYLLNLLASPTVTMTLITTTGSTVSARNLSTVFFSTYLQKYVILGGQTAAATFASDGYTFDGTALATLTVTNTATAKLAGAQIYGLSADGTTFYMFGGFNATADLNLYSLTISSNLTTITTALLKTGYLTYGVIAANYFMLLTNNSGFSSLVLTDSGYSYVIQANKLVLNTPHALVLGENAPINSPTDSDVIIAYNRMIDTESFDYSLILNVGWISVAVQKSLIQIALDRGNTFVILDGDENYQYTAQNVIAYRNNLNIDSKLACLYAPFQYVKYSVTQGKNVLAYVSGLIASQYVFNDNVAAVWEAVAGPNRGVLNNAIDLPPANGDASSINGKFIAIKYSAADQGLMYQYQVNPIIKKKGFGIMINGNKTLQALPTSLQYINVERSVETFIEPTCRSIAYSYEFEDNDTTTQNALAGAETAFLTNIKGQGGLYGFKVICDASNNPPISVAQGILNVYIAIQPVRSAEYIIITFAIQNPSAA